MRGAVSVVAAVFSVLSAVALAVVLVAATAIAVVPRCCHRTDRCSRHHRRCRPSHCRCRDIRSLSPCCPLLPHLLCYCSCRCHRHVTPALAAVVAAVLPPRWPLLPSLLPPLLPSLPLPLLPCNPRPCRHQRHNTLLSPPPTPQYPVVAAALPLL